MDRKLVPGVEVDYAGRRWRVDRALGPDAVLLKHADGEIVSAEPARINPPAEVILTRAARVTDERHYSDAQWCEAARRRDLVTELARNPVRSQQYVTNR